MHKWHIKLIVLLIFCTVWQLKSQSVTYRLEKGEIQFKSIAPLEIIEATSVSLDGAINPLENTFAFSIDMTSFDGFNSSLQKIHFNENYLESETYPRATFSGKIIEQINWNQPGQHDVRAKGILDIHGRKQERIIRGHLTIDEDGLQVRSNFTVELGDHNIRIPKIVSQKIAEKIQVGVSGFFQRS